MRYLCQALLCAITTQPLLLPYTTAHYLHENPKYQYPRDDDQHQTQRALRIHPVDAHGKHYDSYEEFAHSQEFQDYGDRCHQLDPTDDEKALTANELKQYLMDHDCDTSEKYNPKCDDDDEKTTGRRNLDAVGPIVVPVRWHAMRKDNGGGVITDDQILDTVDLLNEIYGPDFKFTFDILSDLEYVNNGNWYQRVNEGDEVAMKSALRKGDCGTLNIYSLIPRGGVLGWAGFPWQCEENIMSDGVVIVEGSVVGGNAAPFNLGYTLVHEVGHWLGLFHTFEGGCVTKEGEVADTPPEKAPAFGCPVGRDSCADEGTMSDGADPITNFMDYSDDSCMDHFTPMQRTRMKAMWTYHRGPKSPTPPPTMSPTGSPKCTAPGEVEVKLVIHTDDYGDETNWSLRNDCTGEEVLVNGVYEGEVKDEVIECLPDAKYTFTITDQYDDGICCKYGDGFYRVYHKQTLAKQGGKFGAGEDTTFGSCDTGSSSSESFSSESFSSDDVGPTPVPTLESTSNSTDVFSNESSEVEPEMRRVWTQIFYNDFEADNPWGNFNSGGDDARRHHQGRYYHSAYCSLFVRDDLTEIAAITSNPIDVSTFDTLRVKYWFYPWHMEMNDGYLMAFRTDGSGDWIRQKHWNMKDDGLKNNEWYNTTQDINVAGVDSIEFRFQADANHNKDRVHIDDVEALGGHWEIVD